MDWKQALGGKEALHWKRKYERTVKLCKVIWENEDSILWIKMYLTQGDDCGASQLWNELEYPTQKLLITAPRFGGPFTTAEVKKIKELWEVTADDIG